MIRRTALYPSSSVVLALATLALGLAGCSSPLASDKSQQPADAEAKVEPRSDFIGRPTLPEKERLQNRIIVKLKFARDGRDADVIAALGKAANAQVTYLHSITPNIHIYTFTTTQPMLASDMAKQAQQWSEVEYAEADKPVQLIR
jgi:hypothetical protein